MEGWSRWGEDKNLPKKMELESLTDGKDGLVLKFCDSECSDRKINVIYSNMVLAYRNRDEGDYLKTFKHLSDTYGDEFYTKWSLFKVKNSEFIEWFNEESLNVHEYQKESIEHYVFITVNDVIEIISPNSPEISC
ncbi:hypothetical protein CCS79_01470 [Clostridium diolis]|uniref:hypothetical protein n=1 Tax=Clostridium diolis TaxID=223919 RepID=UPI000B3FF296|nr:hypothetical protein [Clostridium diolis]OVE70668.1 hypothetical protein CCS79_01470 [Clostridium diolis]